MKLSYAIERYVARRHLDGVRFSTGERVLANLLRKTGDSPVNSVTALQVTSYLQGPKASPVTQWKKYRVLKAFFSYWMLRGEMDVLPLPRPRPAHAPQFKPLIYAHSDLRRLIETIDSHGHMRIWRLEPITLRTVLLFLYGTGALISETLSLTESDVDLKNNLVTLHREGALGKRTIPIGPSLHKSMSLYLVASRDWRCPGARLFIDKEGRSLTAPILSYAFKRVRRIAAIHLKSGSRVASLRDFRHTFAVHCLNRWLNEGKDLRQMLPALSAYMGHVKWSWTEQYLSSAPERFWKQLSRLGLKRSRPFPAAAPTAKKSARRVKRSGH
jgi:integrase/recombinase XerD